MDCALLSESEDIANIKEWLQRAGINSVYGLSRWDNKGNWCCWDFHDVPVRLLKQQNRLIELLEEATPVHRSMKDAWGWGHSGRYTTAAGYSALHPTKISDHPPNLWEKVWDPGGLPKVFFFFWVHNRVLTGENLAK